MHGTHLHSLFLDALEHLTSQYLLRLVIESFSVILGSITFEQNKHTFGFLMYSSNAFRRKASCSDL